MVYIMLREEIKKQYKIERNLNKNKFQQTKRKC